MKITLVLVATTLIFGSTLAHHGRLTRSSTLKEDLREFLDLLPQQELIDLLLDNLSGDSEMLEVVAYIMTDEFRTIISTTESIPEFRELVEYLHDQGVDIMTIIDLINDATGLPPMELSNTVREKKTLKGLLLQIKSLIPEDSIQQLYQNKISSSPDFKDFIEHVQSEDFYVIVNTVKALPEFQNLNSWLLAKDVDLREVVNYLKSLFSGK